MLLCQANTDRFRQLWQTAREYAFLDFPDTPLYNKPRKISENSEESLMFLDGLDELDQKIIRLLIKNARMSYSDIGQQIGISRVAVKMRVQALEQKGIIEEYTTIINPQKISGAISCYFEIETAPETLMEAAAILRGNDSVTQIYRVTGKSRLHVHAVAASNEEMEELIHSTIDRLPGVLECSTNVILSRIKDIKGLRL